MVIAKPMIPWVGGKGKLLPYIVQIIPPGANQHLEPFGGGGALLLSLPPVAGRLDIYNDYNRDLVNMFVCARDRPLALIRELGFLPLNSRAEFEYLLQFMEQQDMATAYLDEEIAIAKTEFPPDQAEKLIQIITGRAELMNVRRAAAFFKISRYSYSGTMTSYGVRSCNLRHFFHLIWSASRRLENVVIECQDAIQLIRKRDKPGGVIYCDPPYFNAERSYAVLFTYKDHSRLHRVLRKCKGNVIVSYNDCRYIRFLYDDFYILAFKRNNPLKKESGSLYGELLITNYDPRPYLTHQFTLFGPNSAAKLELELVHIPKQAKEKSL